MATITSGSPDQAIAGVPNDLCALQYGATAEILSKLLQLAP